jgi:amidase
MAASIIRRSVQHPNLLFKARLHHARRFIMLQDRSEIPLKKANLLGWIPTIVDEGPFFDPLTASAADLAKLLSSGQVTSVQILNEYYRQILKYNGHLKAVLQLAPGAIDEAKELDAKRARGETLGPLHGIPILLKDNIGTEVGMGMVNTGSNVGLIGSYTTNNAPVVERLLKAGAIIMGKTALSEMMWFKYADVMSAS